MFPETQRKQMGKAADPAEGSEGGDHTAICGESTFDFDLLKEVMKENRLTQADPENCVFRMKTNRI